MASETKLKSCPFCGSEVEILYREHDGYLACCSACDGMVEKFFDTEEEAMTAWNKRTPEIVYCRECMHNRAIAVTELKSDRLVGCSICMHNMPLDGYCSNGRRK